MIKKKLETAVILLALLVAMLVAIVLVTGYFYPPTQPEDGLRLLETGFYSLVFISIGLVLFCRYTLQVLRASLAERDRQAKELKRERDFAASLLTAAPVNILLLDAEGKISYVNPCFEQLTGYRLEEIKDRDWFSSFLPARDRPRIRALFDSIDLTTSIRGNVNPIIIRNGEERYVSWSCEPLSDSTGQFVGIVSIGEDVTGQRLYSLELERNAAVIRFASDFIAILGLQGELQYINEAGMRLLGLEDEEQCRKLRLADFFADDAPPPFSILAPTVLSKGRWLGEQQLRNLANGEPIVVSMDMFRIDDPSNGQPINFGLVARDLSPQKAIEESLRVNQWRLNEAQRIAKVGSWELEFKTGELLWTDEIYRLFELDRGNFAATYEAFLNAIHPDDREKVHQAFTNSLILHIPYQITHRILMRDGRVKWVEECGYSSFDAEGHPIRSWGTVQDITGSHLEAEAAMSARIELQAIIDAATELSVISTDAEGLVSLFNEGARRMLGYPAQEVVGKKSPVFFHVSEEITAVGEMLSKQYGRSVENLDVLFEPARCGDFSSREWTYVRKDGSMLPVSLTVTAKHNVQGEIIGFLLVASDITERKRAEAALVDMNEELEQRVAQRTAELVKARDDAERANHAKSQFLSRMSHELRTPLNAIIGFSQLLETDNINPLDSDQLDSVQEILKAGRHLLELINEILDLARIESGRLQLSMEVIAVQPLLKECINLFQPLMMRRQIGLTFNNECHCAVYADRLRLRQIILNLMANAIKYNRDCGHIWVDCGLQSESLMRIFFRDTGGGIPEQDLPNLFQPFERLESAYSGVEGSGIGLALCKQLIEAMDGSIGVQSTVGEGSLFWVDCRLPERDVLESTGSRYSEQNSLQPRKLLYIEDDSSDIRLMQKIVAGYKNLSLLDANNIGLGVKIAKSQQPDLVVLNVDLLSGGDLSGLRRFREHPSTRHIPVLAITEEIKPAMAKLGKEEGFIDYLAKPLDNQKLKSLLDQFFSD